MTGQINDPAADVITGRLRNLITRNSRAVVYVCGYGASGKTTFCRKAAGALEQAAVLETDWFLKYSTPERRRRIEAARRLEGNLSDEENPQKWYDWQALSEAVESIRTSGVLRLEGAWNQRSGEKDLSINLSLPEGGVLLVDGIYLLHPEIRSSADLTILLQVPLETALARQTARDKHRSAPEYLALKAALARKYDEPYFSLYGKNADLIIGGS